MTRRYASIILVALATAAMLGACASSQPATPVAPQAQVTELKVAATAVGDVVTDANGRVLYMFTKDTQGAGTSACTGDCLTAWPPALADSALPKATGVTGAIGTIDVSGRKQVTLHGWPLYYFAQDAAAGAVKGQGVNRAWYVLDAAGTPVKTMPSSDGGAVGY